MQLATSRPRDFAGLETGWCEPLPLRWTYTTFMHLPYGPALLTGDQWTHAVLHLAARSPDAVCLRCHVADETLQHRIWSCPANIHARRDIDAAHAAATLLMAFLRSWHVVASLLVASLSLGYWPSCSTSCLFASGQCWGYSNCCLSLSWYSCP